MTGKERREELRRLMRLYGLTPCDVARILDATETSVRIWLCNNPARDITPRNLRLLKAEMRLREIEKREAA